MENNLTKVKCIACSGDMPKTTKEEMSVLLAGMPGWISTGVSIRKIFVFRNFKEALAFFNKVAEVAEAENHHPDMCINRWKNVMVSLTTHAVKGLTLNDFIVAAKVEAIPR